MLTLNLKSIALIFHRETDIRAPPTEASVLVNLMSVLGRTAEAKCLSINSRKPEQIAVGANDPFVRVYDRRKLKAQLIEVRNHLTNKRLTF
jgi:hypothetical protein